MKTIRLKTTLPAVLICLMSIFALISCEKTGELPSADSTADEAITNVTESQSGDENSSAAKSESGQTDCYAVNTELGQGKTTFVFEAVADGMDVTFTIHTDETMLDKALLQYRLIAGDNGAYGLYIKEVNGVVADYDKDGTWWGLYSNGNMLMTSASDTKIENNAHYELKKSK